MLAWMLRYQTDNRRLLRVVAVLVYAAVFACFAFWEWPGLGIGHFYYVAIVLAAMSGDAIGGVVAGVVATVLYGIGVYLNDAVPTASLKTEGTALRLVTYVLVGWMIGYYASRSRTLLARSEELAQELRALARRDFLTGLPNQRAFEVAVSGRIADGKPFVLVVCDVPEAAEGDVVESFALGERLTNAVGADADAARIGNGQFAVVASVVDERDAADVTGRIERALASADRLGTAGWAFYPRDSRDGLGLYTAASERLYARKIARGEWQLPLVTG
jgi:GGDEF domain-containing protein